MNKYLEFYAKIFKRYKIIIYSFVATLILLEHKLLAYLFYALSFYELTILCIDFWKENRDIKNNEKQNDIVIYKLKLEEKKETIKQEKLNEKKVKK